MSLKKGMRLIGMGTILAGLFLILSSHFANKRRGPAGY